jgi:restriction system protein
LIPKISEITKPLLELADSRNKKWGFDTSISFAEEYLGNEFKLTSKEMNEKKATGNEKLFVHIIRWARTYLKKAGLITDTSQKGHFVITELGKKVIKENPEKITESYLNQFQSFKDTRRKKKLDKCPDCGGALFIEGKKARCEDQRTCCFEVEE